MKINDIAHLCGYFSTSDSGFAEKIAADPFWTPCLHTPEEVENGSKYYFTDADGNSVTSNIVTLNMISNKLTIVKQPENVCVASGESATVTVEATGEGLAVYAVMTADKPYAVSGARAYFAAIEDQAIVDELMKDARQGAMFFEITEVLPLG